MTALSRLLEVYLLLVINDEQHLPSDEITLHVRSHVNPAPSLVRDLGYSNRHLLLISTTAACQAHSPHHLRGASHEVPVDRRRIEASHIDVHSCRFLHGPKVN